MKKAILIILAVGTVAAGIFWVVRGRKPTIREARADFCTQLRNYGVAVVNLRSIGKSSTKNELNDAQKAVQESWEDLQKSASNLKTARLDALQASYADLESTIQLISKDAAVGDAQTQIYRSALNTLANTLAVDQATCKFSSLNAPGSAELLP